MRDWDIFKMRESQENINKVPNFSSLEYVENCRPQELEKRFYDLC